jgi:hypothetical protein
MKTIRTIRIATATHIIIAVVVAAGIFFLLGGGQWVSGLMH